MVFGKTKEYFMHESSFKCYPFKSQNINDSDFIVKCLNKYENHQASVRWKMISFFKKIFFPYFVANWIEIIHKMLEESFSFLVLAHGINDQNILIEQWIRFTTSSILKLISATIYIERNCHLRYDILTINQMSFHSPIETVLLKKKKIVKPKICKSHWKWKIISRTTLILETFFHLIFFFCVCVH